MLALIWLYEGVMANGKGSTKEQHESRHIMKFMVW